jgi:uncharacterized membrane protein YraQ (UPF0718 family)
LIGAGAVLLCMFWFGSRYPQLLAKSQQAGQPLASMAFASELVHVAATMPWWARIAASAVNWLNAMKIGMAFGVAFGALLHTTLRYYPLRIGSNRVVSSIKGALVGAPAGVCANCAVPVACGVTRGQGRVEMALGFLFSSPNLNPIVVTMTFAMLPASMAITKYAIVALTIVVVVPGVIALLERRSAVEATTPHVADLACSLPTAACDERFGDVLRELGRELAKNAWMLARPTIVILLGASLACAVLLELVPWPTVLANTSPIVMLGVAVLATFMPVPIALDVLFAALLLRAGAPHGYVMLFAITLGMYSIVPSIYLWREVSRPLAVILFALFVVVGWMCGLAF